MGTVHSIATGKFIAKNKNEFYEGLKGYVGGDFCDRPNFLWSGGSKKGNNVEIELVEYNFDTILWKGQTKNRDTGEVTPADYEDRLDLLKYIQEHLVNGGEMIIHHVEYEHASNMCIYKYIITKNNIEKIEILNQ